MAHYGLGSVMKSEDIIPNDMLGGLTQKVFSLDYFETKDFIYSQLEILSQQLELHLLK